MKIDYFYTLDAVLRGGSFAAAAAEVNLTPSAVSIQMKRLEAYFGQPLFDRSSLQVKPTPFAREVGSCVHQTLDGLSALRQRTSIAIEGSVKLGLIETVQVMLLPRLIRFLHDTHPYLRIKPVRGRTVELIEEVKAGAIDAAIVAQPDQGASSRLSWRTILDEKLVLIAPPDSKEDDIATLFKTYDWIRFDRNTTSGRLSSRFVTTRYPAAASSMELQSSHAIVALVSAGVGISVVLLPDLRICHGYPVKILKLGPAAPSVMISLVSRKTDDDNRNILALYQALQAVARKQ